MRVIFMGTPDFAVATLEAILAEGHEVVAVVTQPDRPKGRGKKLAFSPVKEAALRHDLPVLQPTKVRDPQVLLELTAFNPDVIVVVAYGQILPDTILNLPRYGCLNVHASLLPAYRGAAPIHWAILNGETETGIAIMQMDIGMDTGPVLAMERVAIEEKDSVGVLHDKLMHTGARLLTDVLSSLEQGVVPDPMEQDDTLATYAPRLDRAVERMNWTVSVTQLYNQVRGLNPWPGAYTVTKDGVMLKVWEARVSGIELPDDAEPGMVIGQTDDGILVAARDGVLELLVVQPACRGKMSALSCACGYCLQKGDYLV